MGNDMLAPVNVVRCESITGTVAPEFFKVDESSGC